MNTHASWRGTLADYVSRNLVQPGVTLVFVTAGYEDVFRSWQARPGAPQKGEVLVFACDRRAEETWRNEGWTVLVAPTDGSLSNLWQTRLEIFAALCRSGVDFFHSDADAFWTRDPREDCRALGVDLVFSQGTICPRAAVRQWGFVLCCGFYYVQATPATTDFLETVSRCCTEMDQPHDQVALNTLLLEIGVDWEKNYPKSELREFRGEMLSYFSRPILGRCQAANLDLCLLPHHLFPRLGPTHPDVMVEHLLENKLRRNAATFSVHT